MARGVRNIITHEYGKIDDEVVFDAITKELEGDVRKFVESIWALMKTEKKS